MKKWILFLLCAVFVANAAWADNYKLIKDKTFIDASYSGVKTIKVVQTVLPVKITRNNTDNTAVKCYVKEMETNADEFLIAARTIGSTLEVYQEPRGGSFRKSSGYIEIYAGTGVKIVVVNAVSGSVSVEGLALDNLNASSVSGSIGIGSTSASDLSANTVSGSIRMKGVNSALTVLKTVSGSVAVDESAGNKIDVSTTSGSIRGQGIDFALVSFSSVSGSLSAYMGTGVKQCAFKSVSGAVNLYLKGSLQNNKYSLSSVSGSLVIKGVATARRKLEMNMGNRVDIRANSVSGSVSIQNY